ncbi:MAG: hypothetical protein AAFX09_08545 [Pseudomonadota bacterium]
MSGRFVRKLVAGFGRGRVLRYALVLTLGALFIGGASSAYYLMSPRSYTSGFSLILPGAGTSARVNLETLGSTDASAPSPFSSPSLSPTVQYKRLMDSHRIRGAVARQLGVEVGQLPSFKIRLQDQTPMIFVQMNAGSADQAFVLSETLLAVFQRELDALRQEERAARDDAFKSALAQYEADVATARTAVLVLQSETGLISRGQYDTLVTDANGLEQQHGTAQDRAALLTAQSRRLSQLIGLEPDVAAAILILRGDPQFEALRIDLGEAANEIASLREVLGSNHPDMRTATDRHAGLLNEMAARGEALLGVARYRALRLADINLDDERANMLRQMVELAAEAAGENAAAAALAERISAIRTRIADLSPIVADLEARLRAHRVSETVFASAVARLSTAQTDLFSSYPMVQVLEAPARPDSPTSPSLKIAAGAAIAGYLVFVMGVLLLWLRLPLIRLLWKIV